VTVLLEQLRSPEDRDIALSKQTAEGSDIGSWIDRSIEENQIEMMQRQFG